MRRRQLVELEDLSWFPRVIRDGLTSYLAWVSELTGQIEFLLPPLERLLRRTGENELLDLCSGGAGPMPQVVARLRSRGLTVHATLSDFYPNREALAHACAGSDGTLDWIERPIDALRVPEELPGVRTMWNAFHHFPPERAREILASAVRARRPIAVFEFLTREPLQLVGLCISPFVALLTAPLWRPFRMANVFFSWLVPVIPLVVFWDGIVSWLRIYDEDELRELVTPLADVYEWEIGRIRLGGPPAHAGYLLGAPRAAPRAEERLGPLNPA